MRYFDIFPSLKKEVTYLDNVSSLQLPREVIQAAKTAIESPHFTVGKGNSLESNNRKKEVERVREQIANFINADSPREIFFLSNATQAMWSLSHLLVTAFEDGDEILLSPEDHESTITPWIHMVEKLKKFGRTIQIKHYFYKDNGEIDTEGIIKVIGPKTRLFIATQIHNIYGTKNEYDIATIKQSMGPKGLTVVDVTESVGRTKVDVQAMKADFALFSANKVFSIQGSGILYARKNYANEFHVTATEKGSPNYLSIHSLGVALSFMNEYGETKTFNDLASLTRYAVESLKSLPNIEFSKGIGNCDISCSPGYGIISFRFHNISAVEVGFLLAEENIIVRAGDLCNSDKEYVRVGLHIYNTKEDIDLLIQKIKSLGIA